MKGMIVIEVGVPVWEKYTLSITEATEYFGIGEKRIRRIVNDNRNADYVLQIGNRVRIKSTKFEEYLINSNVV